MEPNEAAQIIRGLAAYLRENPNQVYQVSAKMVGVRVGDHNERQLPDSLTGQERNDHPASGIALTASWTRVDQDPTPCRCPEDGTISLADIEKM